MFILLTRIKTKTFKKLIIQSKFTNYPYYRVTEVLYDCLFIIIYFEYFLPEENCRKTNPGFGNQIIELQLWFCL